MEIKGRIIHVMPLQSGIGQVSGKEWKKQEYVLETQEQYPRKVCFQTLAAGNPFGSRRPMIYRSTSSAESSNR